MFVDSASRFQRPYGTRDKSASTILDVVQRFVANMEVPRALLGCGSFVRGLKRRKGDSIPFILSRRDYMSRFHDECP